MDVIEQNTLEFEKWLELNDFPQSKIKICNKWEDSDERGTIATFDIGVRINNK